MGGVLNRPLRSSGAGGHRVRLDHPTNGHGAVHGTDDVRTADQFVGRLSQAGGNKSKDKKVAHSDLVPVFPAGAPDGTPVTTILSGYTRVQDNA